MFKGTLPTAARVLKQLLHDHRTLALLWFVPTLLLVLLRYVFDKQPQVFDVVGPSLIAFFPFLTMFLVTSVATQRERNDGTLERLMRLPIGKGGYVLGYALAFSLMSIIQAAIVTAVSFNWLGLSIMGSTWLLFTMSLLVAVLGVSLGLASSALAKTEFQAVQFMPLIVMPQVLLCGLLIPRERMHDVLKAISDYLPLSYVIDGLKELQHNTDITQTFMGDLALLIAFVIGGLLLGILTLRRKTA